MAVIECIVLILTNVELLQSKNDFSETDIINVELQSPLSLEILPLMLTVTQSLSPAGLNPALLLP